MNVKRRFQDLHFSQCAISQGVNYSSHWLLSHEILSKRRSFDVQNMVLSFFLKVCKVPENCQVWSAFVRVGKGPSQVNNESPPFLVALLD